MSGVSEAIFQLHVLNGKISCQVERLSPSRLSTMSAANLNLMNYIKSSSPISNAYQENRPPKISAIEWISLVFIGVSAFLLSCAFAILNPRNTAWLRWGDSAQHYLGWEFFRRSDLIQFPIGNNPSFGTGFSSSIFYSDAIPLLALPLKYLLRPINGDFQYLGIWILACFILQAIFAFKIISRFVNYPLSRLLIVGFFCTAPAFIFRFSIDGFGHFALGSHFLILWAIDTYIKSDSEKKHWFLVLCLTSFIQPYMVLIVLPIFLASEIRTLILPSINLRKLPFLLLRSCKIAFGIGILLFVFGGFSLGGIQGDNLRKFRATLTSLIDPGPTYATSWSSIIPDINADSGTNEGFGFLGLGVWIILLLVVALKILYDKFSISRNLLPLFFAALVSFILSLSPLVSLGSFDLFEIPTGQFVYSIWSVARSAGRFIWPPLYIVMIWAFASICIYFRRHSLHLSLFLAALLSLQIYDGRHAFSESRERFVHTEDLYTDLGIWDKLASRKKHLVVIPSLNNDPEWVELAFLALRHDLTTNAASIDRISSSELLRFDARKQQELENFAFDSDTLYVVTNYPPNPFRENLLKYFEQDRSPLKMVIIDDLIVISS